MPRCANVQVLKRPKKNVETCGDVTAKEADANFVILANGSVKVKHVS